MQLLLPLDHEPCLNHQAKLMADEMVASGDCLNWDHAYECAWNVIEDEIKWASKRKTVGLLSTS